MKFNDRKRLAKAFERWAKKNGVARSAFSVITWLDIIQALNDDTAEQYLLEEEENGEPKELPPCPICGAKAFLHGDTVDGNWMGWSIGCPRYSLNDGVHGAKTPEEAEGLDLSKRGFSSKAAAVRWWFARCRVQKMNGEKKEVNETSDNGAD